ncbi:formate/nitrite transporter [Clostridiales Family XIII bacterium PM5-7]
MGPLKSKEILSMTIDKSVEKANGRAGQLFVLGILAGMFLALAGAGGNVGSFYFLNDTMLNGIGKFIFSLIFPTGLMMIVLCGGELFTGNNLMITGVLAKRISAKSMLRNWIIVYAGNFIGSVFIAWMFANSGLLQMGDGLLGTVMIKAAASKVTMPILEVFIRAILCNILVCLAIWMSTGADTAVGKMLSVFFPVSLFVVTGLEHCIANMFYIPIGLFADGGLTEGLTWNTFVFNNLLPVTFGNLIGGGLIIGCSYYFAYHERK